MNKDKMYLVNKIFNNETIRTVWDKEQEKYFISVVDVVGVLADSSEPRKYWNWLKNRIKKEENFETSSITRQLKLKAQDGKYRLTDVVDIEGMFRIVESVPSKNTIVFHSKLHSHLYERYNKILQKFQINNNILRCSIESN